MYSKLMPNVNREHLANVYKIYQPNLKSIKLGSNRVIGKRKLSPIKKVKIN